MPSRVSRSYSTRSLCLRLTACQRHEACDRTGVRHLPSSAKPQMITIPSLRIQSTPKSPMTRQILVTSALPYANGPIHIGHLVEYIQTDIWVRFQRLRGNRCVYICADDTHGTAIMIRARKEGRSEVDLIAAMSEAHQRDFAGFDVQFDHYGSTNSEANQKICGEFWQALREANLITERSIEQLFDPEAETFLADRFVRGTCPKCGRTDQAGDNCTCGHTYSPTDLIDPKSTLSGATPVLRESKHLFVQLEKLRGFLNDWVNESGALQSEVANYLKGHFLSEELRDWDISLSLGTMRRRPISSSRSMPSFIWRVSRLPMRGGAMRSNAKFVKVESTRLANCASRWHDSIASPKSSYALLRRGSTETVATKSWMRRPTSATISWLTWLVNGRRRANRRLMQEFASSTPDSVSCCRLAEVLFRR